MICHKFCDLPLPMDQSHEGKAARRAMRLVLTRINYHLYKLCNLVAGEIAGVRDIRFVVRRAGIQTEPLWKFRYHPPGLDDIYRAVVIVVGAPSPFLKETPTGL